ncbi:bifunctional chorismate mutase/prephenate dehydratase [Hornefia butyriciproducens]|uniref:bifunctional chorismate mutase/prephenate dehydratase n=1 Tax=Hornefia butyriciproducens TaxID=2652293 RepID=UPI002A90AF81|nr:bifunctional chorismate mutase/prephenate dehydratase [Hornefia butyriciproducens]MDY5423238.1 bifunctional chorismate mutase/prephenate dehydratase [Hornefia butyriciproducens]
MNEISDYEKKISQVDDEIMRMLKERLMLSEEEARLKKEKGLPVHDPVAERRKLEDITARAPEDMAVYTKLMYNTLNELTKDHQRKVVLEDTPLVKKIKKACESTPKVFPERALVACQGVQGAYQQQACDKLFSTPKILYTKNFNGVFAAIDQGLCQYGVLPLENSTAGSVNTIYDLMTKYNFYIVRSVRLKINHCLLAKKGVRRDEIREIFSHEQAILQCEDYLKNFRDVKVTVCANTAEAAELVSRSERRDAAALASYECGELYDLDCLEESVQDSGNNYTRFICISKNLEIYPGANKTSLMLTVSHKPGSLYNVLARFYALDINLFKLESRPIPTRFCVPVLFRY